MLQYPHTRILCISNSMYTNLGCEKDKYHLFSRIIYKKTARTFVAPQSVVIINRFTPSSFFSLIFSFSTCSICTRFTWQSRRTLHFDIFTQPFNSHKPWLTFRRCNHPHCKVERSRVFLRNIRLSCGYFCDSSTLFVNSSALFRSFSSIFASTAL